MINNKLDSYITSLSSLQIIIFSTILVLTGSIPIVYLASLIGGVDYTLFLVSISIALPLILTPVVVFVLISLTKSLRYFKEHLKIEIERNKEKDLMLFEQARFALMGEMMANISHQWKQPLNTIGLSVVSLNISQKDSEEQKKYFTIIEDNVRFLAETIDDFMSFFDKRTHSEVKSISDIVREIKSIIGTNLLNHSIKLDIQGDDECENIYVSSSISQVILNLVNNSIDALAKIDEEKKITLSFIVIDNSFSIVCSDNGSGVDVSIKESIFNPYFTTKHKTQGIGIGLYMSKQIIDKFFAGTLELGSREGFATSFIVTIPFSDKCILKV